MGDETSKKKGDDESESEGGKEWAALLRETLQSFLLMRDLLGYLVPGTLLLFLVHVASGGAALSSLRGLDSNWLLALALFVLSYVAGQIVIALGYRIAGRTSDAFVAK